MHAHKVHSRNSIKEGRIQLVWSISLSRIAVKLIQTGLAILVAIFHAQEFAMHQTHPVGSPRNMLML